MNDSTFSLESETGTEGSSALMPWLCKGARGLLLAWGSVSSIFRGCHGCKENDKRLTGNLKLAIESPAAGGRGSRMVNMCID